MLFPKKELDLSTPKVMGVLNLTPDSFFDGGKFLKNDNTFDESKVLRSVESMIEDGADFIDIGAHSTKPGFTKISPQEELDRIGFIFEKLKDYPILFSVDSFNYEVIKEAILKKIDLINNVFSFEDEESFNLVCNKNIPLCVCHQGNPENKENIFAQIELFFSETEDKFMKGNFDIKNLIFDPGFGYGKTPFQNLKILSNLEKIKKDRILLAGLSQKKFLKLLFETKENHLNEQSLTAGIIAGLGGANILRVHQVKETVNLMKTIWPN